MEKTLADFGFSPGEYFHPCKDYGPQKLIDRSIGSKRNLRCKKHAQEALDKYKAGFLL